MPPICPIPVSLSDMNVGNSAFFQESLEYQAPLYEYKSQGSEKSLGHTAGMGRPGVYSQGLILLFLKFLCSGHRMHVTGLQWYP